MFLEIAVLSIWAFFLVSDFSLFMFIFANISILEKHYLSNINNCTIFDADNNNKNNTIQIYNTTIDQISFNEFSDSVYNCFEKALSQNNIYAFMLLSSFLFLIFVLYQFCQIVAIIDRKIEYIPYGIDYKRFWPGMTSKFFNIFLSDHIYILKNISNIYKLSYTNGDLELFKKNKLPLTEKEKALIDFIIWKQTDCLNEDKDNQKCLDVTITRNMFTTTTEICEVQKENQSETEKEIENESEDSESELESERASMLIENYLQETTFMSDSDKQQLKNFLYYLFLSITIVTLIFSIGFTLISILYYYFNDSAFVIICLIFTFMVIDKPVYNQPYKL
jgi:hypothetical protein